ncbi:MAG: D-aminoacylase [Clostridia bacterium]|nr:D-aminoacylase [Clostridia bacterium]
MYDLIIKDGTVIDGTGVPAYHCDIAIADGKIVRIASDITDESKKIIDARGLTVTPGFIDSHSHSDNAMFDYPDMIEKIEQGITTSIGGQCGSTLAPSDKNDDVFKTFGSMVNAIKNVPLGSNIKSFVGHSALRKAVIGYENRKPSESEMNEMKTLLREAMENGAIGLSFGLIYTPSCYADTKELIELVKVVKEYNGIVSAHIRNEGFELIEAVEEFLTVIKETEIKAVFSHHKSMYHPNWGKVKESLRMIKDTVAEGYDIYCDVYPYEASSTSLVATLIAKELRALDSSEIVKMLSDSNMRDKIKEIYISKNGNSLSNLLLAQCKGYPEYEGMRIDEIANLRGQNDFDAAFDIIIGSRAAAKICNFSMSEEDVEYVLKYERSMICTDSSVAKNAKIYHPRLRGSFPRFLGIYVREKKVVAIEEAIRKCTLMPASVYELSGKGKICEGFDADICIFDAERIIDKADYINCSSRCDGLNYVILGGEIVVENAIYNGKKKGKFILHKYNHKGE